MARALVGKRWCHTFKRQKSGISSTDQVIAVRPLEVFLHCAVIQPDPGVIMTQTWRITPKFYTWLFILNTFTFISYTLHQVKYQISKTVGFYWLDIFCFFFCNRNTHIPLMNSCSGAEMMLLRWALCSLQSFSASSQVCLWVKYLWESTIQVDIKIHISYIMQPCRFKRHRALQWVYQT